MNLIYYIHHPNRGTMRGQSKYAKLTFLRRGPQNDSSQISCESWRDWMRARLAIQGQGVSLSLLFKEAVAESGRILGGVLTLLSQVVTSLYINKRPCLPTH